MRLYSFSSKLLAVIEAKRLKTKCAAAGILMGAIIFFGFVNLNESAGAIIVSHSGNLLAAENTVLRQQLGMMSPRITDLEMQMGLLYELDDNLHMLLPNHKVVGDTISHFTDVPKDSISNL